MTRITVSKLNYVLLGSIFIIALFFSCNFSVAANPCPDFDIATPPLDHGLACLIIWTLHAVFLLSGVLLFFLLLINGIRYFFVFGNPEKLKQIKASIKSAFIGTIILLLAVTITTFLNPELLLHKGKPDVDLVISLEPIVLRAAPVTHRDIFYNPDVYPPANVSFNIYWMVRGATRCKRFYRTPVRDPKKKPRIEWSSRASPKPNYLDTGMTFYHYVITIKITEPQEIHVGTYTFGLRCYDEAEASITRKVVVNLRFVQAQLSRHQFQGDHDCDGMPARCCPKPTHPNPIYAGYKWEICTKEMLDETEQPHREILGTGGGWMHGDYHCNNWNTAQVIDNLGVYQFGGTFNVIHDITMFHRAACNIRHNVWCCMIPVSAPV